MEKTKPKPKGKVSHVAKKSPAAKYTTPNVYSVAAEITATDNDFLPVASEIAHYSNVFVVVPAPNHINEMSVRLNHRAVWTLDCGFKIKLPAGFHIRAEVTRTWANRGLWISNAYIEDDSLKLVVINIGHETPLVIPHKANIAQIWAEPVYHFDWSKK